MRKLIALFSVLFIVLFAFDTYAITIPPQFNDEITGPSTVCTGTVGNYTLVMEKLFCIYIGYPDYIKWHTNNPP